MNNTITSRIKNFFSVVLLVGVLLFTSTACGTLTQAKTSADVRNDVPEQVKGKPASEVREDLPKTAKDSQLEGGVNLYPDTAPGQDTSRAESKAKALIDNAQKEVIDQSGDVVGNTKRILEKKGENLKEFGQNAQEDAAAIPARTQNTAEELSAKAKSNLDSVAEGANRAGKQAQRAAEDASDTVKSGAKEASKKAQRAAEDTADTVKSGAKEASKKAQRAAEDTADAVR